MVDVSSFETSHVHSRSPTQSEMKKGIIEEKAKTVPFYKLFSFSDSTDVLLMIVGSIGAIGNGLGFPLMTLLFGDLIDTIGRNLFTNDIVELISKVRYTCTKETIFQVLLGYVYFILFGFLRFRFV